jgi:predicted amidophosphoribosyltransferase
MPVVALQAMCDLALPRTCVGCAASGTKLCGSCELLVDEAAGSSPFRAQAVPCPAGFPPTWAQVPYDGVIARMLREFKDSGRADAGPALGRLLRSSLAAVVQEHETCRQELLDGRRLLIVPMPSRPASIRARGREPTAEVARRAVSGTRCLALRGCLRVAAASRDQVGLGAVERATNVRGTMRVTRRDGRLVAGRVVVVLDDIVTTGSSLVEARSALVAAGARCVTAATIAATQRHTNASGGGCATRR